MGPRALGRGPLAEARWWTRPRGPGGKRASGNPMDIGPHNGAPVGRHGAPFFTKRADRHQIQTTKGKIFVWRPVPPMVPAPLVPTLDHVALEGESLENCEKQRRGRGAEFA